MGGHGYVTRAREVAADSDLSAQSPSRRRFAPAPTLRAAVTWAGAVAIIRLNRDAIPWPVGAARRGPPAVRARPDRSMRIRVPRGPHTGAV